MQFQHFFGLIRHAAGDEDHPTASMFVQLYRLLSVYSLFRLPRRRANSFVHYQKATLAVPPARTVTKRQAAVQQSAECIDSIYAFLHDDSSVDAVDVPPMSNLSASTVDNIVFYVCGFVVRHCQKVVACSHCVSLLSGESSKLPQTQLINTKLRGALRWPSDVLFLCLRKTEDYVSQYLSKGCEPEAFNDLVEQTLPAFLPLRAKLCESHASAVCAEIAVYYIVTRLHWHAKQITQNTKSGKTTSEEGKVVLTANMNGWMARLSSPNRLVNYSDVC